MKAAEKENWRSADLAMVPVHWTNTCQPQIRLPFIISNSLMCKAIFCDAIGPCYRRSFIFQSYYNNQYGIMIFYKICTKLLRYGKLGQTYTVYIYINMFGSKSWRIIKVRGFSPQIITPIPAWYLLSDSLSIG